MAVDVQIPTLGESVSEGVIVRWLKRDGEQVRVDEPLFELETDKATVEIPAPAAGVIAVLAAEGSTVKVGDVVARMGVFMADLAAEQARLCEEDDVPRTIAIVSHSVAIKSMVAAAMNIPAAAVARMWPTPASLTVLQLRVTPEGGMHNNHLLALGVPTS